ncbi:hypothetical protein MKEN_00221500 [Mycena kentingensis (nom. inval.)]|nr:hypothetical protein MKEN_00221500 [Mycena kentingensis (nom. inval.)]
MHTWTSKPGLSQDYLDDLRLILFVQHCRWDLLRLLLSTRARLPRAALPRFFSAVSAGSSGILHGLAPRSTVCIGARAFFSLPEVGITGNFPIRSPTHSCPCSQTPYSSPADNRFERRTARGVILSSVHGGQHLLNRAPLSEN